MAKNARAKDTTVVDENELPPPAQVLINVPETIDAAVERIKLLEVALEDLLRASEIAQYSGQFEVLGSFQRTAEDLLTTKIVPEEKEAKDMNITIIS